jgi:hypothetical protein
MQNLLAVYAPRLPITSQRFAQIAAEAGYAVRFVKMGVYINPERYRGDKTSMAGATETFLLCGWIEPGNDVTVAFDAAADGNDRDSVGKLLKKGDVSWVELYTDKFDYDTQTKRFPKQKNGIDNSVPKARLPVVTSARSRYILHNKGRRKSSAEFMTAIADALAAALDGVVANFVRPGR